ncbi:MAG TPA: recombination protein NinB [Niastella sp.]
MKPLLLYGTINQEGILNIQNRDRLKHWCWDNPGKEIRIRFAPKGVKRSLPQNAYYWGVVIREITIALHDLGHQDVDDETVHEIMKMKFNNEQVVNEQTGEVMDLPKSTTDLTKTEFAEYVDRIRQWASEFLSIDIPGPKPSDL